MNRNNSHAQWRGWNDPKVLAKNSHAFYGDIGGGYFYRQQRFCVCGRRADVGMQWYVIVYAPELSDLQQYITKSPGTLGRRLGTAKRYQIPHKRIIVADVQPRVTNRFPPLADREYRDPQRFPEFRVRWGQRGVVGQRKVEIVWARVPSANS